MTFPNAASCDGTLGAILHSNSLLGDIQRHVMSDMGNDFEPPRRDTYYQGLALAVRDRMVERWIQTQRAFYDKSAKRVYYLSMEFLPGRFLVNNILNLGILDQCRQALAPTGLSLEDLEDEEWDPGLGNGGLGRLASCYLDAMATLGIAGYGYGLRYDYGIFHQSIVDGYQVEQADNWVRFGSPWEFRRRGFLYPVRFYGRSEAYPGADGRTHFRWVDADTVMAMACDILIPGFGTAQVNNMRLWAAVSSREFNLQEFNEGDYIGAVQAKVFSENISKVLYPKDEKIAGKELRLKQQYFFVAATFQDIVRRYKKAGTPFSDFPKAVAVQLNDTHPSIAIAEFMRILLDEELLEWDAAWDICVATFAYTNHTVLPEALEVWPADLLGRILPRHLEIIYEIDRRFTDAVTRRHPNDPQRVSAMAIVQNGPVPQIRMAHLAIVGSHRVNGVSALHSRILKTSLFRHFDAFFPGRFTNVTNGITPRRWLMQANPPLSALIGEAIGPRWIRDLNALEDLVPLAGDKAFIDKWRAAKLDRKQALCAYIRYKIGAEVEPASLFDVQAKRIHEYKRQLLNLLHVITLANRIRADVGAPLVPRTVIFAGKAAPGYFQAKLIIKLINAVAAAIEADDKVNDVLRVIFLPNYCVSQAQKLIPAAELSQQISVAGMEASGTGNMKFALNGALTIGTMDGANIEIMEHVGRPNIFIFGRDAEQIAGLKVQGYDPNAVYQQDEQLRLAIDQIRCGRFSPGQPDLFAPIVEELLNRGDRYCVLADYRAYVDTQDEVARIYADQVEWNRRSILNTARMGYFSSDRAVAEYARRIWRVTPLAGGD